MFNQPIDTWNTAAVTDMKSMFDFTYAFNQPIGTWNTAAVTDMKNMFYASYAFNQPIGTWNTAAVTDMSYMFSNATVFNQPIGTWTLNASVDLSYMLPDCGMDCGNYSATLNGWSANAATPSGRSLGATGRQYGTNAVTARTNLDVAKNWTFTGDAKVADNMQTTFYADTDGDNYGNAANSTLACTAPSGYVANSTDCNDMNASIKPGATETCNSIDDDCDTQIDEEIVLVGCPIPTNLNTTNITSNSAVISWNNICAPQYRLCYRKFVQSPVIWTFADVNTSSKSLINLSPNTKYAWRTRSKCTSVIMSVLTVQQTFTTLGQIDQMMGAENSTPQAAGQQKEVGETILSVSPNPTNGIIRIKQNAVSAQDQQAEISVLDMSGKVVFSWKAGFFDGQLNQTADLGDLPTGMYVLRVRTASGQTVKSVMKQ